MTLIDSHVHVGQFHDVYYAPDTIIDVCKRIGIDAIGVSSTTICIEDHARVLDEFRSLLSQQTVGIIPILWITPNMLEDGSIERYVNSGINWKCIKVHNYQQQGQWGACCGPLMKQAVTLAKQLKLPMLFHTGNEFCYPMDYRQLIEEEKDQLFILAHSRPVDQTIEIMQSCPNAWADTAFTPVQDIVQMVEMGLEDRIMWGTDMPLMSYYSARLAGEDVTQYNYTDYYQQKMKELSGRLSKETCSKVFVDNAKHLWGIL